MGIKHLLSSAAAAALTAAGAQAATFDWQPVITNPYVTADVTAVWQLETIAFNCMEAGAEMTEVMPVWIDDDGNEITATGGIHDPWGFDSTSFEYTFNVSDFKSNGEYVLLFPQGMLVNAAGEESAKKEIYYTFDVPELMGAMFDDFKVISTTPNLNTDQGIWSEQKLTVNTNHNDAIGLTKLIVTDRTTGEVILTSSNFTTGRTPGNASEISWTVAGDWKFYQGHNYKAELIFYNGKDERNDVGTATPIVDRATYQFSGKVEPYKYSSIELLSVEPDPNGYIISEPSEAVFRYVFSGPVNVLKAETPLGPSGTHVYPNSCLSSNADKTEWTLDLSNDEFVGTQDSSIIINIYVADLEGYVVEGNNGYEADSCFQFSWECELGAPTFTIIPVEGSVLDALTEVVCKSDNDTQMAWSWNGSASVYTISRQLVGTLIPEISDKAEKEVRFETWVNASTGVEEPLNLTKGGSYVLVFDKGCFTFGTQFDARGSHNMASGFEITGKLYQGDEPTPEEQEIMEPVSISPEAGSTVKALTEVFLNFSEPVGLDRWEAYLYESDALAFDNNYLCTAELGLDWDDWNMVIVTFDDIATTNGDPLIQDGDYILFIPRRSIGNDPWCESMGQKGICNPDLFIPFTVDSTFTGVSVVTAPEVSDVYDIHGRIIMSSATREDLKTLQKGIYIFGGKKIIL